ncbi:hypothetical protein Gotur_014503 [Gossypium turneri]
MSYTRSSITVDRNILEGSWFLHVALVGRGCKLDPKLINALVERWRPEMHTFHLPCDECTITLEYVIYNCGYPWMGRARIEMAWLQNKFAELAEDSIEEERERYARAYILQIIRGILMPDKSRNLRHCTERCVRRRNQKNKNWWLPFSSTIMGSVLLSIFTFSSELPLYIPTRNKCRLLSKCTRRIECCGNSDLDNRFPWHLRSLMIYIISNYNYQFRIHGKSYLYGINARYRHPHTSRPRRDPLNLRGDEAGPSSTPTQEPTPITSAPMPTPPSVSWTVGHPSSMWYTLRPSYFSMTVMSMMIYSPSMHEAPTDSPLVTQSA